MHNLYSTSFINEVSKKQCFLDDDSSISIHEICKCVVDAANKAFADLIPGLPKSVYQLKLLNNLSKHGLHLASEFSQLENCTDNVPAREIIVVNRSLVIECIVKKQLDVNEERRIMFDLQNNGHATGVLINFGEGGDERLTTKIYQNKLYH